MKNIDAKLFWIPILVGCSIGFGAYWSQNQNGTASYRGCVESSGGYTDPRTGDGPECERYGLNVQEESAFRTGLRGVPNGAIGGAIVGGILVVLNTKLVEYQGRRMKGSPTIDELVSDARELVRAKQKASSAMFQRELKIDYLTATKLLDHLENEGSISK